MAKEDGYDEDTPTSNLVETKSGYPLDLNNLPGRIRRKLIINGDLGDAFQLPANMPGNKLKAIRDANAEKMREVRELNVGEFIQIGKRIYPITEVKDDKVYYEKQKNGVTKKYYVVKEKVVLVDPPTDPSDIEDEGPDGDSEA